MWQHCLWTAAALLLDSDTAFPMRQHCLQLVAALPSQCGSTAFKQWCHCLCNAACLWNAAALHPNTAALPVDCSNTAFRMWQHCLWTAAALLLDSDTAFPMRQHYLQLVAALPSHGSSSAFTMWHYCLQKFGPLPLECCMPLECCSTASQHCSSASGLQQLCLWTAAALLLDSDTAFPMRQHCLQLVVALPSHGSGSAFTMWQHRLQTVVPLLCNAACLWNAAALHPNTAALPVDCSNTAFRMWQHCLWTAAALLLDSDTACPMRQHCLQLVAAMPSHDSGSAFTMWQPAFKQWCHCLCSAACLWNAAALHPNTAALPVDCSNTAFRMWQHCLWTAAALLLDSDTAFPMRQHYLQLVAALPSHGSSSAFTMWHYCLQKFGPLTGAGASQCVTPRGVRQFGGL